MTKIDLARLPATPAESQPLPAAQPSLETLTVLAQRRSTPIALLTGPGPSRAEIEVLLGLAARVPDHGKLGPWRFLVIEGAARERAGEKLAALAKQKSPAIDDAQVKMERERLMRAPLVVAVISTAAPHPKIPEWEQVLSAGAVAFQLVLAAHAMGFGAAWLTEWPTYDEQARAALGLAHHERIAGLVYIGTAKADPQERVRPDVKTRISWYE